MRFARTGDTVVVHNMDRLARNLDDLRRIVQTLTQRAVCVEFVKEHLVFTDVLNPRKFWMSGMARRWMKNGGWFHPKSAGAGPGGPLFPGAELHKEMVRAEGLEPSRALRPNGFSYHLRLSPPPSRRLWSGLSLHRGLRRRCCPSSLYTFPSEHILRPGLARDCHFRFPRL
jgi:hypothetical protein